MPQSVSYTHLDVYKRQVFLYADRKENKVSDNTPEFFIRRDMEYFDKAFEQAADGKEMCIRDR